MIQNQHENTAIDCDRKHKIFINKLDVHYFLLSAMLIFRENLSTLKKSEYFIEQNRKIEMRPHDIIKIGSSDSDT